MRYTHADWVAEATRRFGADQLQWRFVCPVCKHVATVMDYRDAGAPEGAVAFSCVGRWLEHRSEAWSDAPGPCNYAGGGLIGMNPVTVSLPDGQEHRVFAFAEPTQFPKPDWATSQVVRAGGLVEDICVHDVGHPNPESIKKLAETGRSGFGAHGCCGSNCCRS